MQFDCDQCNSTFKRRAHLQEHQRIHRKERPFVCTECGKQFVQSNQLTRHRNSVHRNLKPYQCEICGLRFGQTGHLDTHRRTHLGSTSSSRHRCGDCGKRFSQAGSLRRHQRVHRKIEQENANQVVDHQQSVVIEKTTDDDGTEGKLNVLEDLGTTSDKKRRKPRQVGKKSTCEICNRSYTSWYLKVHMRGHSGERPFQCSLCGKSYKLSTDLKTHLRRHTGERPFRCTECGKSFTLSGQLKKHQRVHSGEAPYECGTCGQKFKRWGHLKSHRRLHNPAEMFRCMVCNRQYTQPAQLKIHQRKHSSSVASF
ncbi:gastrula zinc finger protein XlCGF7.1-like [Uranotaenia lowii]|uniref:gastrula zinc finger protein XlCGF7.1-like n=1 Tax=Uranotaenia lowii TaxID=190385 RepID=UPI00247993E6|nr:gastrula zinc finger protein XlCGF7.1-like [Uranotaenia lowii]